MSGLWFSDEYYSPVQAGSIDGTDTAPHDRGIARASKVSYNPDRDQKILGDPYKTLFVCRLSWETTESTLHEIFSKFGKITHLRLVRDIVTGHSKGYAFISFERSREFFEAYKNTNKMLVDGREILVEFERERITEGWVPRRYGGGIGGRKESGQLRFGGRDRPFRRPFTGPIPETYGSVEYRNNVVRASSRFDMRNDIDLFAGRKYKDDNNNNDTNTIEESKQDGREYSREYSSEHRDRREHRDYRHRSRSRERRRSRSRERDHHGREYKRRKESHSTDAGNEDAKQTG